MTNEFEITLWLVYHQSILNLTINIQNEMSTRVTNKEEYKITLTSNLSYKIVLQLGLLLPEID